MEYVRKKMIVQLPALRSKLLNSVCDVRFVRRTKKPGFPPTRRMICTKSYELLNSTNGRIVLNYRPPQHQKQINEAKENLLVVWDVLMQNYRTLNINQIELLNEYPPDEFWEFFNKSLYPMSADQKLEFMNS